MPKSFEGDYTLPSSITTIVGGAFVNCKGLTSISISNNVTSIGDGAFSGCDKLTEPLYNDKIFAYMPKTYEGDYIIPSSISSIVGGAFLVCDKLTSVIIPTGVKYINNGTFEGCKSLSSISIRKPSVNPVLWDSIRYSEKVGEILVDVGGISKILGKSLRL